MFTASPSVGIFAVVIAGETCKNVVYDPSLLPINDTVLTNLKNCPGSPANSTLDPLTGLEVSLLTAIYDPLCKKSALPLLFSASIDAVAVVKPLFPYPSPVAPVTCAMRTGNKNRQNLLKSKIGIEKILNACC